MNEKTLHKISYGLYIVSSKKGDKFNGQIANTVFQTTAEPPMVAVCINKKNLTHEYILESRVFTVSILSEETPMKFIGQFGFKSGRDLDKFKDIDYKINKTGVPIILDNSIAYFEAEVVDAIDVGGYTVFIGKAISAEILNNKEPLTYAYYHEVKHGKSPETAPTYIEEKKEGNKKKEVTLTKYECTVCGYIYDPAKGDPDGGIEPGTAFENIPDDWVCPVCGAGKEDFEKVEE